ncbi:Highly reducing polyketide synthase gloL [Colletotrichum sidae]|uniref:Highly reducing polyketide synthase gloL n=1 Tax=Colletotrichum sidae TaxID=1347389 RepID=A0A4R8TSL8_9PEZI|nr:Highly reducing polyketide synthase gloL [Colletotrichum sidae]
MARGHGLVAMTAERRDEHLVSLFEKLRGSQVYAPATAIHRVSSSCEGIFAGETAEPELLLADGVLQHVYDCLLLDTDSSVFFSLIGHKKPNLRVLEVGADTTQLLEESAWLLSSSLRCLKPTKYNALSAAKTRLIKRCGIPPEHICHSRDSSFLPGIVAATNSRGVDLVLNQLSGELLQASWQCVAEFGSLVELGCRDFLGHAKLAMEHFESNRPFAGVDLTHLWIRKPRFVGDMLDRVLQLCAQGHVRPWIASTFAADEISQPFRQMQKSQHIGKLVVTMPETEAASTLPTEPIHRTLKMRKDRSCLPTIPSTFFFPFSSIAATGGWWGQANYHAGNAFVESFAAYGRQLGLAASVLNVGFIGDAGYVADRPEPSESARATGQWFNTEVELCWTASSAW